MYWGEKNILKILLRFFQEIIIKLKGGKLFVMWMLSLLFTLYVSC